MGAEENLRATGSREASECFIDFLNQRVKVAFVTIEAVDSMDRNIAMEVAAPLVQAAAHGRARIMRIERQEDDFVAARGLKLFHGFSRKRMPIAHGDEAAGLDSCRQQGIFKRPRLHFRKPPNRGAASDD